MLHNYCKPSAQSSARENFFKKILSRGKHSKHYTSRVLYIPFYSPNSPIFGAKLAQCRRYGITIIYRGTNNIRYTITTDRAQLGDRCATVVAKWSRNPQSTLNILQNFRDVKTFFTPPLSITT